MSISDPNIVQVRQLLLDPAVHREFVRMRGELEDCQKELKHTQVGGGSMHISWGNGRAAGKHLQLDGEGPGWG